MKKLLSCLLAFLALQLFAQEGIPLKPLDPFLAKNHGRDDTLFIVKHAPPKKFKGFFSEKAKKISDGQLSPWRDGFRNYFIVINHRLVEQGTLFLCSANEPAPCDQLMVATIEPDVNHASDHCHYMHTVAAITPEKNPYTYIDKPDGTYYFKKNSPPVSFEDSGWKCIKHL